MKKCFTINCLRTKDDFISYEKLLNEGLFSGLELFYPYNVTSEQRELYSKEVEKLVIKNEYLDMVLHLPHGGDNDLILEDGKKNDVIIKRMKDAIDFASNYRVRKLTLHLGSAYKDYQEDRGLLVSALTLPLQELCDYAGKYEMNVMIENMPRDSELGYSPQEILTIIKNVKRDNLKFIYDTGHAHVSEYHDLEYIDLLKDYLYHIHFSDNKGISDEHKPLGYGNIDFVALFKKLNEIKYPELHCLEIIFKDACDLVNNAKAIEEFDYLYN